MLQNSCILFLFLFTVFSSLEAEASLSSNRIDARDLSIELGQNRDSEVNQFDLKSLASAQGEDNNSNEEVELARVEFWGHVRCQTHVTCSDGEVIQCSAIAYGQVICDHAPKSWVRCEANGYRGSRDVRYFGCD